MNSLRTLLIMNIKLLLRNKGFLFFLLVVPVFSVMLLNIRLDGVSSSKEKLQSITDLKSMEEKAVYERDYTLMPILVYDKSMSELSGYFLEKLAEAGICQIYRVDAANLPKDKIAENMEFHLNKDIIVSFLYLDKDFDKKMMDGRIEDGITFYQTGLDEREELLLQSLKQMAALFHNPGSSKNAEDFLEQLRASEKLFPKKQVTFFDNSSSADLTESQKIKLYSVKFSIAIVTIAFLYAGIFVSQTAVEEKNNLVYTRLKLTGTGDFTYMLAKIIITLMTGFFQTAIMGIGIALFVKADFGISTWNYLLLIGLLGMIFCNMSLVAGILMNNVMSASYLAFMIWSISSMLAGLYFPLDDAGRLLRNMSRLMPQRWTVLAAEGMMGKESSVYFMIVSITAAYLLVIISTGVVGLRFSRNE